MAKVARGGAKEVGQAARADGIATPEAKGEFCASLPLLPLDVAESVQLLPIPLRKAPLCSPRRKLPRGVDLAEGLSHQPDLGWQAGRLFGQVREFQAIRPNVEDVLVKGKAGYQLGSGAHAFCAPVLDRGYELPVSAACKLASGEGAATPHEGHGMEVAKGRSKTVASLANASSCGLVGRPYP